MMNCTTGVVQLKAVSFLERIGSARRMGGFVLYVEDWIYCKELPLKNSHDKAESLWAEIRDQTNKGLLMVNLLQTVIKESLLTRPPCFS